jgi:hypothetical protein
MSLEIVDSLTVFGYKIACLFLALSSIYMGYRLFLARIEADPTDAQLSLRDWWTVNVKKAAPGTMFALFGMLIAITTAFKGYDVDYSRREADEKPKIELPESPPG